MERHQLARLILRISGGMLMLSAAVHLMSTQEIPHLLDGLPPGDRSFVIGPTLLNHVLVGILLFPLGFTTWLIAEERYLRETWTKPILIINSLVAFAFPPTLMMFMGPPEYQRAPLFVAAAVLTMLGALSIPIAALIGFSNLPKPA